jgi:hypothetical protein
LQAIIAGLPAAFAAVSARSMSTGSWPSHEKTAQPEAAKRAFWSVTSEIETGRRW